MKFRIQQSTLILVLIAVLCMLLNLNTLQNKYSLDDEMVINSNLSVQKGFAGIPDILTSDAYQSFFNSSGSSSPLTGGRYRPLSIVSFAIEQQIFGEVKGEELAATLAQIQQVQFGSSNSGSLDNLNSRLNELKTGIIKSNLSIAPIRHALQVIFFTLLMISTWLLLSRYIFPDQQVLALMATLLFLFHPIHTEVIANLKSRDEIFSLLFILLSLIFVFRYNDEKNNKNLLGMVVCFLLALLSKEYAIVFPAIAACSVIIFRNKKISDLHSSWLYLLCAITVVFLLFRSYIIGDTAAKEASNDLINNPYYLATTTEKIATRIYVCFEYIKLLLFPHPLSSDYSFRQIPYVTFTSIQVWLSVFTFLALGLATVYLFIKKHVLSFALLFFFAFFFLINNTLFDIGATMGERLIFHSCLGFCIIASWCIWWLVQTIIKDIHTQQKIAYAFTCILLLPMGYKTIARNSSWEDNFTLFTTDVRHAPNSALTNGNAGAQYFNRAFLFIKDPDALTGADSLIIRIYADSALPYLNKAIEIHPRYTSTYLNRAICYLYKNELNKAVENWRLAIKSFNGTHPTMAIHASMLMKIAYQEGIKKHYATAAQLLEYAVELDPANTAAWNNLGGAQFSTGNFKRAAAAFSGALALNPSLADAQGGLNAANNFLILEKECRDNPANTGIWLKNAIIFEQQGFPQNAFRAYTHVLEINTGNKQAQLGANATKDRENKQ
jgi:Tfp pilus assembly protein PilF